MNTEKNNVDMVVIGGGPGGYVSAIRASQLGMKTVLVERDKLGGICLNWGCIPTKALLRSAEVLSLIKNSTKFGIQIEKFEIDYPKVIKRSRDTAERLSKGVEFLMKKNNIETIYGTAKFIDKNTVEIELNETGDKRILTADYIIIATGARPKDFPGMEPDGKRVLSYKHAMVMEKLPESITIIGGGAIGVEFAYFFRTFGSEVTIIEMLPHILPLEDEEISSELEKSFKKRGVKILTGRRVENIHRMETELKLSLERNGEREEVSSDYALIAVGVIANTENIGLEGLGISTEKGWIKVNEFYQTSIPNIYAIGDVIGGVLLAHIASREGIIAVEHISGREVSPLDYKNIPQCTYCHPQVASVGYTEKEAIDKGYSIRVGRFPVRANGKALAMGDIEGFAKVIFDKESNKLLGCHIIASEATELITEITVARTLESTYKEILQTVHPHPTLSEIINESAAQAFGEAIHI